MNLNNMITFNEALSHGFTPDEYGNWSYKAIDDHGNTYELCFERLLSDGQYYVGFYKNQNLLTDKVVIKAGK